MGAWATASLFVASILWIQGDANPQLFPKYQRPPGQFYTQVRVPRQQRFGYFFYPRAKPAGVATQPQSASSLKPQNRFAPVNINYLPAKVSRYDLLEDASPRNSNFDENFEQNLDGLLRRQPQAFPKREADKRQGDEEQHLDGPAGYDDYRISEATHILGPHQVETIQSEHYHKKVPEFDVSDFQHHQGREKHGDVHYHQHKHIHKHDHKQEHVHQHKNDHQHKHLHNQEHKHDHHSDHKHGHEHKHDHHQSHKHDHHHDHKHDHNQEHKHDHHHGHKHQHHSESKHQHKHGHKHENKHGHEHKHKHEHSKHY